MSEVRKWLDAIGLAQYGDVFETNDLDIDLLGQVDDQLLKDIGVSSAGHRLRIRNAIAKLNQQEKSVGSAGAATDAASASAERRQVTVMFSDLVGSTALSARMDPEDLREVISAYQKCAAETVQRFGGFVAKYMGDGVLVYFGYPQAHEDDAERAVRAGLELVAAVGALKTYALQTRVGIATGLVVVGDLIGSGASQEQSIVGETPNLAARLQGSAEPNSVVIGESTRRLVGNLFELEELGPRDLKGIAGPVRAWTALRSSRVESRFEALRTATTPLVGRDEEIDLLTRRWEQAKAGNGCVVLISGEPGIGKSRIAETMVDRLAAAPYTLLRYFCSPYHQDSALFPFITELERAAEFARDDTVEQKLRKLQQLIVPNARGEDDISLLTELLSLPNSAANLNLSPQRKREMLFEALLHQLTTSARRQPVLVVFEDAHWVDPTSCELLDLIIRRISRMRVLIILTFRPEFQHAWSGQPHVTVLVLNRLGEHDGAALVEQLAGNAGLSRETIEDIVERADGVPLFVEELTKAVLESSDQNDRVTAVLGASSLPKLSVPATLQASLIARVDRLGPIAKEVGQIGAVIGREFGYELIEQVAQRPATELRSGLDRLVEAGLLFCRGIAPQNSYLFKHALVQDAAYGTLLRARRQELHARVAAMLERNFADLVERQPELLAHHLTAAGDIERAVDQWLKAGQNAAARSTPVEAIRHFERGLEALSGLPEGSAREGREIELQLARGLSLFTAKGFGAAEAPNAYARARELAERWGDPRQQFMAVFGLWQSANGAGKIRDCRRLSDQLLRLTASTADDGLQLQAHHSAWATSMFAGNPAAAREHCDMGCRLYDPERHRFHHLLYGGHDPGVCAGSIGAVVHWLLGYPERALAIGSEAVTLAERIAHPFSRVLALLFSAMLCLERGEPDLALQRLEIAEALASEQRLGLVWEPQFTRGGALSAQGAFEDAVGYLRAGLASRLGALTFRPYGLACLAQAMAGKGEFGASLDAAREGLKVQGETGYGHWDAELHRLEGMALLGLKQLDEGQRALEAALRVAKGQQAKAYELRAAMSLARLWRDQGKVQQARELLAPVYGWFTEGFDTRDLKEARVLLEELAA